MKIVELLNTTQMLLYITVSCLRSAALASRSRFYGGFILRLYMRRSYYSLPGIVKNQPTKKYLVG